MSESIRTWPTPCLRSSIGQASQVPGRCAAAAFNKPTTHPARRDTHLLNLVHRNDEIWIEWDRLFEVNEDDPRIPSLSEESTELEREILVTPAFTSAGLAGKRRTVERAELSHWDDLELIDVIFRLDAERVAAAG